MNDIPISFVISPKLTFVTVKSPIVTESVLKNPATPPLP